MDVLQSLTQHEAEITLTLVLAVLVLTVSVIRLSINNASYQARWRELLKNSSGESLETLLQGQLRDLIRVEQKLEDLDERIRKLEGEIPISKRHMGLVRYDAFDDVGGNQSFALAIYDDQGNGAVVTSIIGRVDCRVYCKPLINLRSERDLSQEEQRAIREAKASNPRSLISRD
jgi:Protein of unknown function (DUF4446)